MIMKRAFCTYALNMNYEACQLMCSGSPTRGSDFEDKASQPCLNTADNYDSLRPQNMNCTKATNSIVLLEKCATYKVEYKWGWSGINKNIYWKLSVMFELEWDKLAQNPALAFYQNWPWLCPQYSVSQSLEYHSPSRICFGFLNYYLPSG